MSTIILNIKTKLHDFLSCYQQAPSFAHFFSEIRNFYKTNKVDLLKLGTLEEKEIDNITQSLQDYQEMHPNQKTNKLQGRFFTPKSVCRFINIRILKKFRLSRKSLANQPKVLDPSSGLGFFLIDMIFLLVNDWLKEKKTTLNFKSILSTVYGYEIDEKTRNLSINLLLSIFGVILTIHPCTCDFSSVKTILQKHIILENFMQADVQLIPDVVVGNPPYIRVHKMDPKGKIYLRKNYFSAHNDFDIYVCFFEKSMKILPKGGILGYITPEKYLQRKYGKNLRFLLLINSVLLELIDVSRCRDIFEVFTYPLITILRKTTSGLETFKLSTQNYLERYNKGNPSQVVHFIRTSSFSPKIQNEIHSILDSNQASHPSSVIEYKGFQHSKLHEFFQNTEFRFIFILDPIVNELEEIFQRGSRIGDTNSFLFSGTPRSKYYHQVKDNILEAEELQKNCLKFIMSKNITPYQIFWGIPVIFDRRNFHYPQYNLVESIFSSKLVSNFRAKPKLILKANSRNLTAGIDNIGYSFIGAYGLIWNSSIFDIEIVCAIINSDLINYYINRKYKSYMLNSQYLSINSVIIKDIPLPGRIDEFTRQFHPILPQQDYEKCIQQISQLVSTLRKSITFILSTGNLDIQAKVKQFLYESQIHTRKSEKKVQNEDFKQIQSLFSQINENIYDLYGIPQSIRLAK